MSIEQNREPRNKLTHICQFMTKEPRIYKKERIVSLMESVRKIGLLHAEE